MAIISHIVIIIIINEFKKKRRKPSRAAQTLCARVATVEIHPMRQCWCQIIRQHSSRSGCRMHVEHAPHCDLLRLILSTTDGHFFLALQESPAAAVD